MTTDTQAAEQREQHNEQVDVGLSLLLDLVTHMEIIANKLTDIEHIMATR